jgi:4-hydroxy-3-methylbut-2-enyl diphosphate reductase
MKIILAQPRGFCAGVERAINIVERALDIHGGRVYVRHEIVHNKHVVDTLKSRGAVFVDELDEVPRDAVTVFSAHGVGKAIEEQAEELGLHILDATCPLVAKVHNHGRRFVAKGYSLLLIGHAGHPEVIGTMGQIPAPVVLVQNQADVEALEFAEGTPLAYITQTTLSVDDTSAIIHALKQRFPQIVGPNTSDICYATQNRQAAVRELSQQVDIMLVVGAQNSSNSQRLCEIAAESGISSYLVANGDELQAEWLSGAMVIGIAAGASAPEAMVNDLIAAIRRLVEVEISVMPGHDESVAFRLPAELL